MLLSAAAGSGKTSVLAERFVRAVREDGIPPARILAITFTERAAGELKQRVRERLRELGERDYALDAESAFVGTFHGFCARLLRTHPLAADVSPGFQIIERASSARLQRLAFRGALAALLESEGEQAVDLLAAYGVDRVQVMIEGVHAELRSRGERRPRLPTPAVEVQGDCADVDGAAACSLLGELLAGFARSYEELKRRRGAVDFDDLELRALELLEERQSVRATWSERFELLMVDEFQDSNPRQLRILRALDRGNLFTVGDEFQSIYSFRHADVGLFRARRAELAETGGALALTGNFRSRPALLDVVNGVFAERFAAFTPMVAARRETEQVAGAAPAPTGEQRQGEHRPGSSRPGSSRPASRGQGRGGQPSRGRGGAASRAAGGAALDRSLRLGAAGGSREGDCPRPAGGRAVAPGRGSPAGPARGRAGGGRGGAGRRCGRAAALPG